MDSKELLRSDDDGHGQGLVIYFVWVLGLTLIVGRSGRNLLFQEDGFAIQNSVRIKMHLGR